MKKIAALFLAVLLLCGFTACTPSNEPPNPDQPGPNQTDPNLPNQNQTDPTDPNPQTKPQPTEPKEGVVNDLVKNFWQSEIMYDESVLFIAQTDEEGNVVSAPKATLLFPASEILSAKQYFHTENNGEIKEFSLGKDFTAEGNTLTAAGSVENDLFTGKKLFSTSLPYVTDKQLSGEEPFPDLSTSTIPSRTDGLFLPFTEGYQIVQMQVSVTYRHPLSWNGATPDFYGEGALKKTVEKLKNKDDVDLFVFGDSISTGANSSSVLRIPPNLETWPELVAENLSSYYGRKVRLTNKSVGGFVSGQGVNGGTGWVNGTQITQKGLAKLFESELLGYLPDLVFLGFGMNDASMGIPTKTFKNNMCKLVDVLREVNPDCEIVLIGTMLANPMAKDQSKNQTEMTEVLKTIAEEYESVCVVDLGSMHADILAAGKCFTEISSNNVNHPNDFMARVYAMNLLSALIDFPAAEGIATVCEKYLANGYQPLFADPFFRDGVKVFDKDGEVKGTLGFGSSREPAWQFSQWGTRFEILDSDSTVYSEDGKSLTCSSRGKDGLPAKVLRIDSERGAVYLELNAEAEYESPRKDGESWPHTLLSQGFDNSLVHVCELHELVMDMEYTITKFEDKMGASADASKHCAQLVWYITLQNRTRGDKGYGQYIWFGLNLWDNRNVGKIASEYAAQDLGKADATLAFIYQPSSKLFLKSGKIPQVGVREKVRFDVLSTAKSAFSLAKERGYLPDTRWEDIYIGSMNFGFENTGTYNSAARIDAVGVYYK